ncbi:Segregation and condensation protein A [uncultured archaeon]|nr:Segregation and condensation protein A [uncultured archaeon]
MTEKEEKEVLRAVKSAQNRPDLEQETPKVHQDEIHKIIFSRDLGWQEIIYDLINTEQLDPWDVDIVVLTDKYLVKIRELEEADFFISSKVLLAASLLLRIKSELLLNKYIKSIDEILFGRKELKKSVLERIELDEDIPFLVPRSPIPRFRKVTLQELIESLNKAIITENRRIKKEIVNRNALREVGISLPKKTYSIKDRIESIFARLSGHFEKDKEAKKVTYSEFVGPDREERIISFSPLLHLENQKKVWLEQEKHFDEIDIWLQETYFKYNPNPFEELKKELEKQFEEMEKKGRKGKIKEINEDFENPLDELMEE